MFAFALLIAELRSSCFDVSCTLWSRALIRPGRLEEHIMLQLPSYDARERYVYELLGQLPLATQDSAEGGERRKRCAAACAARTEGRYVQN
jgi:SpoVK/Ycf46/Vps4 family AAA+-type ATPase